MTLCKAYGVESLVSLSKFQANSHLRELLHGAGIALLLKIVGAFFMLTFGVLITRTLGAKDSGTFFLALSIITIASVISRLGLDNVIVKSTSAYTTLSDWSILKNFYKSSTFIVVTSALTISILIWFISPILANKVFNNDELEYVLRILTFGIIPIAVFNIHGQFLRGLKKISLAELVLSAGVPIVSFTLAIITLSWGLSGITIAYVIAVILIALLSIFLFKRKFSQNIFSMDKAQSHSEVLRSAMPLFVATIMGLVIERSATIFLGFFGTSSDVAIYEAAYRTTMAINFLLAAINSIGAPKFAALYAQGDMKSLGNTVRHSARLLLLMAAPFLVIAILIPDKIMEVYGHDFVGGSTALVVLALGQFVNAATGSVGYLLMMTGNEVSMRNIVVTAAIFQVILCFLLIPNYGVLGAAAASSITIALANIASSYYSWVKLKILSIGIL